MQYYTIFMIPLADQPPPADRKVFVLFIFLAHTYSVHTPLRPIKTLMRFGTRMMLWHEKFNPKKRTIIGSSIDVHNIFLGYSFKWLFYYIYSKSNHFFRLDLVAN